MSLTLLQIAELSARHSVELAEALRQVPWAPQGIAVSDDSPETRAAALMAWALRNPGVEANAILGALRPTLLRQLDEGSREASALLQGVSQ